VVNTFHQDVLQTKGVTLSHIFPKIGKSRHLLVSNQKESTNLRNNEISIVDTKIAGSIGGFACFASALLHRRLPSSFAGNTHGNLLRSLVLGH